MDLNSDILHIEWLSIVLGFIPKSITHTQQTHFTHIGSKRTGLKWDSHLIKKTWKLIHDEWLHRSRLKHAGEALDNNTKEFILDAKITDEHVQGQDTLH